MYGAVSRITFTAGWRERIISLMRSIKFAVLALGLSLFAVAAVADSITSLNPQSVTQYSAEELLAIDGTGLEGQVSTTVVFSGQGGTVTVAPNSASSTELIVEIPSVITQFAGTVSVTVNAQDLSSTRIIGPASLTITALGAQPPLLSMPEVVTKEATSASGAIVTFSVGGISFVDPSPTVTCDHTSGVLYPLGTTVVHCTATDSFSSTSGSFNIVVTDTVPPVLTLPAPISVITAGTSAVVTYTVTATDAIDGSVTPFCSPASGSTFGLGTTTVECSAHDSHANSVTGSFTVTVAQHTPPTLSLPQPITAEATGPTGAIVTYTATANQGATVVCSPASGSLFSIGTTTVDCTATNGTGEQTSGSFTVTVEDTTPPVLSLPADITTQATDANGAIVSFVVTATDTVSGSVPVLCTPASGSTFPIGTTAVQCVATDGALNTASGSFNVKVTAGPVLTLPSNITAEATSPSGAVVTYTATATDPTDGTVPVTCTPASGSTFPLGTTTVNCSATDSLHFTTTGSFTVTVVDTTPPTIHTPGNLVVEATGPSGAVVNYVVTATDLVDVTDPVTCVPASGSTFALGTALVQCTSTDLHGNTAHASFSVTVQDTTPPALTLPSNITVEATGPSGAVVTFTASAVDLVDGPRPVTCTPASGSTFPLGTTTVQCSASDLHGNTANGSFTVTVHDTTPPTVSSTTATPNTLWPPNHQMVDVTVAVVASDTVDPNPTSQIVSVSSNQPINGTGDGDTAPDWIITGPLTLQLRSERAATGGQRIYTITVATSDFSGNTTTTTCTVTVGLSRNHAAAH